MNRNPLKQDLDINWIKKLVVNDSAVELDEKRILRAAQNISDAEEKIAFFLKGITLIDLTTLAGDDSFGNVSRLCMQAQSPIPPNILKSLNMVKNISTAAICVYPSRVADVFGYFKKVNEGVADCDRKSVKIAAVAGGFPSGQFPLESRLLEIQHAVNEGVSEIDIVIDRSLVIRGKWQQLYDEISAMKEACGANVTLKTIISVGELPSLTAVYRTSLVALMAGSDFIKTSTGKEAVNATIPYGLVMARAIREFERVTGIRGGLKAAGGLRTPEDVLTWMTLVYQELGRDWLEPSLFRIGASSLLDALVREIIVLAG